MFLGILDQFIGTNHFVSGPLCCSCPPSCLSALSSPFCQRLSNHCQSYTNAAGWEEMMRPVCVLAYLQGLIHSSSHVILLDSGSGALWERLHSDFQGSLKNSVKMALTLSAVNRILDTSTYCLLRQFNFFLFSSISIMGMILESFFYQLVFWI